ncbi:MAG: Rieske 2Fe-2S domain-containing protein [Candidatus Latescibacteria bacterium]|nr:Rieske 2Fe-2S domain-containing protein [Candidatus Latescibacterota bacterium]
MKGSLPSPPLVSRRLVNALLGLGFAGVMGGMAGAVLAYLWPERGQAAGSDLVMGAEGPLTPQSLGQGQGVVGRSQVGKVLVVHQGEEWIGLLATCTHLGCTVSWNPDSKQVECPCHGARYGLRGEVLRGPARQSLGRVELAVDARGIHVVSAAG